MPINMYINIFLVVKGKKVGGIKLAHATIQIEDKVRDFHWCEIQMFVN